METILRYRIPGPREDNLGDKLADKLRPGGRIGDNSALQDSGAPGLSEDNLGDKLADKLGDNLGPEARIGDNSALQDSGAPGLSEDDLGDKLADKLGDNLGPEARIGDNSALQDCGAPQIGGQTEARRPDWRQFCVTGPLLGVFRPLSGLFAAFLAASSGPLKASTSSEPFLSF